LKIKSNEDEIVKKKPKEWPPNKTNSNKKIENQIWKIKNYKKVKLKKNIIL
jgi:hypothetical protein